jgi:hypothetical protein
VVIGNFKGRTGYVDDVKTIRFIYVNMREGGRFLSVVSDQWSVGDGENPPGAGRFFEG